MQFLLRITKSKLFLPFILGLFALILFSQSDHYFKWTHYPDIPQDNHYSIHTDGSGYYSYLPEWFLYENEKPFTFLNDVSEKYKHIEFSVGVGRDPETNELKNKYYPGTAISSAPLFLISCAIQSIFNGVVDGYSWGFELTVVFNSILFWLLGCIAIIKLLKFWEVSNWWTAIIITTITFGTSINFYTVYFPSFSHICSFMWISWFIYFGVKWAREGKKSQFLILCAIAGMIFLVRPTNILIVAIIPFLFSNLKEFGKALKILVTGQLISFLLGAILLGLFISFQLFNVHWQTGDWKLSLYDGEGFDFLKDPQIFNVLFSYKKGFFVYAPVMFVSLFGVFWMWKKEKILLTGWLMTSLIFLYITSAWWCWWYGGGLGMRPFVDITTLLILPLIFVFKYASSVFKIIFFCLIGFCIYLYQIFQVQYKTDIIHYDLMTKESFWNVFLETDGRFAWSAAFVDDTLPNQKPDISEMYYMNMYSGKLEKTNQNKEFIYSIMDQNEVKFLFIPDSSWSNKKIGIKTDFHIELGNKESNPCIDAWFFKDSKEIEHKKAFVGYRVHDLNEKTELSIPFSPNLKYGDVDSIVVQIGRGVIPTKYEDVKINYLGYSTFAGK